MKLDEVSKAYTTPGPRLLCHRCSRIDIDSIDIGFIYPPYDYARQDLNSELIPLNLCDQEVPNRHLPDIYALRPIKMSSRSHPDIPEPDQQHQRLLPQTLECDQRGIYHEAQTAPRVPGSCCA